MSSLSFNCLLILSYCVVISIIIMLRILLVCYFDCFVVTVW